jgi:hypothetical protein
MRLRRYLVALLLLSAIAFAPTLALARPVPLWTAGFDQAACLGSCCLITTPFFEMSCGEYRPSR